ncbi:MAG TPA: NigD-like C-terminal domain-containing protein [Bacteroidales bacterium]|nr:NigD-like C-terminal domain-containing protein [Bacteroidales bacterium]
MPKFYGYSILSVLALFFATGCTNEDLSNNTYYESAWCVVQGRGSQISLLTDQKDILKPTESLDSAHFQAGDRYRVLYITLGNQANYSTVSGSKLVKISGVPQPVLVSDVIQHSLFSGSIMDTVLLNDKPFLGGGFLNFDFKFRASNSVIKHGIYLLQDSLVHRKMYLRFGHHANNDVTGPLESALASFPISSLKHASDADSLIISLLGDTKFQNNRVALKDTL